jgi:hypothetical protein
MRDVQNRTVTEIAAYLDALLFGLGVGEVYLFDFRHGVLESLCLSNSRRC